MNLLPHDDALQVSAVAAIVGVHMLPLAWLFRVPLYGWMGIAMTGWTCVCLLIADRGISVVATGLGMGAILWAGAVIALIPKR